MSKRSPRLLFTDEELAAPELKKAIRKADKRMKKLEKAEAKIPKKTVKKKQRVVDPKTGTVTTRLSFEEVDKKRPPSKLTHALRDAPGAAALSAVHREIREHEQDNVGVESAHGVEQAAERAVRLAQHAHMGVAADDAGHGLIIARRSLAKTPEVRESMEMPPNSSDSRRSFSEGTGRTPFSAGGRTGVLRYRRS